MINKSYRGNTAEIKMSKKNSPVQPTVVSEGVDSEENRVPSGKTTSPTNIQKENIIVKAPKNFKKGTQEKESLRETSSENKFKERGNETETKNMPKVGNIDESEPLVDNAFEQSGIYFKNSNNTYTVLDPTTVTGGKFGGFGQTIKSSFTMGIGKIKSKSKINGKDANYNIVANSEVYFYFDPSNSSLNNTKNEVNDDNFFNAIMRRQNSSAISPNDFKLIKLKVIGNSREVVTGTMNAYGAENGITGEKIISFKHSKVTKQLYKLTFSEELKRGQYCFYYAGNSTNQGVLGQFYASNTIKLFDFGVK